MLAQIEELCAERDRLKKEEGGSTKGRLLGGRVMREQLRSSCDIER